MISYEAEMIKDGRSVYIIIPFNAKEVFNKPKGTIYVKGTINNIPYRNKLISKGNNVQILIINKKLQDLLGYCGTIMKVELMITEDNIISDVLDTQDFIENCKLDVISAISTRKSIRKYTEQTITDKELNTILNAGFCAPSAKNKRPWNFIVVKNKDQLMELSKININGKMLQNANCCIIVCGDKILQGTKELLIADCSASTQNMLLASHGLGIGAVWCGVIQNSDWRKQIVKQFKLPESIIPISVISLGYPKEIRKSESRFDLSKIHNEIW
ncbi:MULTISPECIES: nitroreductase family protein [Clostridium]|nr:MULTISPECIES: nitroreductase family protein [Clostridium]